jgi:hypothetical protein
MGIIEGFNPHLFSFRNLTLFNEPPINTDSELQAIGGYALFVKRWQEGYNITRP